MTDGHDFSPISMNVPELKLDPKKTALVLIDLQAGIAALPVQWHTAADVLANSGALAKRFRAPARRSCS